VGLPFTSSGVVLYSSHPPLTFVLLLLLLLQLLQGDKITASK
jgi:hypothetical protein